MDIRPLRTEADYDWALAEIAPYFEHEPAKGTPEADRFDVLADLIEAYESRHWHIDAPDPIEAIEATMEAQSRTRSDLVEVLGSPSRVSEILNRQRHLTVGMVHALSSKWHLPAEVLVQPYHLTGKTVAHRSTRKVAEAKAHPKRRAVSATGRASTREH